MKLKQQYIILYLLLLVGMGGCIPSQLKVRDANKTVPSSYPNMADTASVKLPGWQSYFADSHLVALIDTALRNNQELHIFQQELEIRKNEIRSRKGEYLPFVNLYGASAVEKPGKYTRNGAVEEQLTVKDGKPFPEPLSDHLINASASWEVDVWKKLRNARQSAVMKYLSGKEGRNVLVTNLVAEIASTYYELLALDNLLRIVEQNIQIQSNAFMVVTKQKDAGKVSQLAVNRFEAQLLNTRNLKYVILQQITQAENRINFLCARYPSPVVRDGRELTEYPLHPLSSGVPSQLLFNRPDIRQAELDLEAARLDVKVARARFLPAVRLSAGVGYQAFSGAYLLQPQSLLYNVAGDLVSPMINRNALKAAYNSASAAQLQSVVKYEQTLLNGYLDVVNQLRNIENTASSYTTKSREVTIMNESVSIANSLFNSARADYAEVLLTQREALEAKIQLVEIKQKQLQAQVNIYRALGGGWK